jgi:hypothetical protein
MAKLGAAMTGDEAKAFASEWLPAWTGNDPPRLAAFYTDDIFYSDPSIPDGLSGKSALIQYLSKLLANNPDWTWTHTGSLPLEDGFLNKWRLDAPVGDRVIICQGVCTVQLRGKLIYRNETYFDMSRLVGAIQEWASRKSR